MDSLERIAESLARLVDLKTLEFDQEKEAVKANWQQMEEMNEMLRKQEEYLRKHGEYTQKVRERMEQEDMHRMNCPQCRAHYYGEEKGN